METREKTANMAPFFFREPFAGQQSEFFSHGSSPRPVLRKVFLLPSPLAERVCLPHRLTVKPVLILGPVCHWLISASGLLFSSPCLGHQPQSLWFLSSILNWKHLSFPVQQSSLSTVGTAKGGKGWKTTEGQ